MSKLSSTLNVGILYSIAASICFAFMPAYLQWLPPLHGYAVIGQRILWASIFIFVVLLAIGRLESALMPLVKVKNWPGLVVGAILIGIQWGLFVWAPLNGQTLGIALGYALLPLTLVLVGYYLYDERLSSVQWLAAAVAVTSVAASIVNTGGFSWVALAVVIGYPLYFILRRWQPVPVLSAFFIENLLLIPIAWWACLHYGEIASPFAYDAKTLMLLAGVGVLGSLGMLAMLYASRHLPVALFGLLGYLESPLIFLVGIVVVGEAIQPGEGMSYSLFCLVIALLALDGIIKVRKRSKVPV